MMRTALWIDAQLSPILGVWLAPLIGFPVYPLRDLGLRDADDGVIFQRAKDAGAIILTKDADFLVLLDRHGPPPRIIWLTCGNSTNDRLRVLIEKHRAILCDWLVGDDPLIEIGSH